VDGSEKLEGTICEDFGLGLLGDFGMDFDTYNHDKYVVKEWEILVKDRPGFVLCCGSP